MEQLMINISDFITGKQNVSLLNEILIGTKNLNEEFEKIIEFLITYLSHSNNDFKKNTMHILALIIERLPKLKLNNKEILRIYEIAKERLSQRPLAGSSMKIIYFLITNHNHEYELIYKEMINYLENYSVPNYPQENRFYTLKLLSNFLNLSSKSCFKAEEFIKISLDSMDGEKDPRNILLVFELITKINDTLNKDFLDNYVQNFYDILDNYYPIDFTPPKNSPEKITADDLKNKLNESFLSNYTYFKLLIDSIKEKFSMSNNQFKVEYLKTIKLFNQKYNITNHIITLLNLLLNEILNNTDEFIHLECIITYKEIIQKYDNKDFHVNDNIDSLFEKANDLLFSSENVKNSFDAKDIIVILCEYISKYREKSYITSLKLISSYLSNKESYLIKNANSILFFCFKQYDDKIQIMSENNKSNIKNFIFHLIDNKEDSIIIIDIITCFIVKTDILNYNEVEELFNKIFNKWREGDKDGHISYCLNEIISKYKKLNNIQFILDMIDKRVENYENYVKLLGYIFQNNEEIIINYIFKNILLEKGYEFFPLMEKILNGKVDNNSLIIENFILLINNSHIKFDKEIYKHMLVLGKNIIHKYFSDIIIKLLIKKANESPKEKYSISYYCIKLIRYAIENDNKFCIDDIKKEIIILNDIKCLSFLKQLINLYGIYIIKCGLDEEIYKLFEISYDIIINYFKSNLYNAEIDRYLIIFFRLLNSYMIVNNCEKIIQNVLNAISNVSNNDIYNLICRSKIFVYKNKNIFNMIYNIDDIIILLKQRFQTETNIFLQNTILIILLNIYSNYSDEELLIIPDVIIDLIFKVIDRGIYLETSISIFKKVVKYIDNDIITKKSYNIENIINKLLNILNDNNSLNTKIDILISLYKLRIIIGEKINENISPSFISKKLKPLLKHHKRKVRKFAGLCINSWNTN